MEENILSKVTESDPKYVVGAAVSKAPRVRLDTIKYPVGAHPNARV